MKTRKQSAHKNKRKGIAIAWVTLTIIMIVGIMALMLEGARIYLTSHDLQNTADAAALVGARYVAVNNDFYSDPNYPFPRIVAREYARLNHTLGDREIELDLNEDNFSDGDIVIGRYIPQNAKDNDPDTIPFIETEDTPNAIKVVTRMGTDSLNAPLPMMLGKMFGGQPKNLSRYAIAVAYNSFGAGVIACAPDGRGLYVHGNITLDVAGGAIVVNSEDDFDALHFGGASLNILAEDIRVTGAVRETGFDSTEDIYYHNIQAAMTTGVLPTPCPYADVPEPPVDYDNDLSPTDPNNPGERLPIRVSNGEELTLWPGYYSRGIEMMGGVVNMQDGIYHLGGDMSLKGNGSMVSPNGGLDMTGGTLNASNTLIHIVDNGTLYVGANSTVNLSPYTYEGHDFSIFQSRDMNHNGVLDSVEDLEYDFIATIIGTSDSDLEGILYFPENMFHTQGGGATLGTQLVAYRIEIEGGGNNENVVINYNGSPEPADNSYLAE